MHFVRVYRLLAIIGSLERQKETEELHDEAIVQSDLTDDEYETIAFNNETVEEKPEA